MKRRQQIEAFRCEHGVALPPRVQRLRPVSDDLPRLGIIKLRRDLHNRRQRYAVIQPVPLGIHLRRAGDALRHEKHVARAKRLQAFRT